MSLKDFEIIKPLGIGAFASVFQVRRKKDNQIYALKKVIIDTLNKKEQENSLNEVRLLASIKHLNIIGYKEAFYDDESKTLNIVMEFADDGDLNSKIKKYKNSNLMFTENSIWSYAIQMIQGLKVLHDKNIMHRDLKSANIFLMKDGTCKLGDLNVSKVVKMGMLHTQIGTPFYASPEVWKERPYNYKSDLWSIGCVIYELCSLTPPFKGKNMTDLCNNVCRGRYERINSVYSSDLNQMIAMLLRVNSELRPTCDEFLNNPLIIRHMECVRGNFEGVGGVNQQQNLLNTIKFRDIKEIKKQLPKVKYYDDNSNEENANDIEVEKDNDISKKIINEEGKNKKVEVNKANRNKNMQHNKKREIGKGENRKSNNLKENEGKVNNIQEKKNNNINMRVLSASPVKRNLNITPNKALNIKQVQRVKTTEGKINNINNNNNNSTRKPINSHERPKSVKVSLSIPQEKNLVRANELRHPNVHIQGRNNEKNVIFERPQSSKVLPSNIVIKSKKQPISYNTSKKNYLINENKSPIVLKKQLKPKINKEAERKIIMNQMKTKESLNIKRGLIISKKINHKNLFLNGSNSNEIRNSHPNVPIRLRKIANKQTNYRDIINKYKII